MGRMFNVLACNRDDHVKNFSFLMDQDGRWRLSPAYDLTFSINNDWCRYQQMTVNNKYADISRSDLVTVAKMFSIKNFDEEFDRCIDSISKWEKLSKEFEVGQELAVEISKFLQNSRARFSSY